MLSGIVYKIVCTTEPYIQYIGSTFDSAEGRWRSHMRNFRSWEKGKHSNITIYPHFKEHGINNFELSVVKQYEVCDREHLSSYEQLWINRTKCVNKKCAWGVNQNNCKWLKTLYNKNYRKSNLDKINKREKAYRLANKQHVKEIKSKYYYKYIEKHTEHNVIYRDTHKEQIAAARLVNIKCPCGVTIRKKYKAPHERTAKHIQNLHK